MSEGGVAGVPADASYLSVDLAPSMTIMPAKHPQAPIIIFRTAGEKRISMCTLTTNEKREAFPSSYASSTASTNTRDRNEQLTHFGQRLGVRSGRINLPGVILLELRNRGYRKMGRPACFFTAGPYSRFLRRRRNRKTFHSLRLTCRLSSFGQ